MYPEIPYDGLTWPVTQHAGVISENVLRGLLEACSLCAGKQVNSVMINKYLIDNGILTANFRADSQQVDAWRDYQQILSELGLIFSTAVSSEVILTPVAVAFIDGTISFEELLTLQLFKYQYPNGHKTQISPSLKSSFPEGAFNYESVAHMQALNGIQVRPAVLVWTVLMQLYNQGADSSVSVDEMQRYIVRATKNSDAEACANAIISSRTGDFSCTALSRARRNMQDWMKLLGSTPLFYVSDSRLYLSEYSVQNADELTDMCQTLSNPETFWIPSGKTYKWDWFAYYGNIDLSISLIPNTGTIAAKSTYESQFNLEKNDSQVPVERNVNLQPFSEIKHFDTSRNFRRVVSEYDYTKSQKGRNLHDSMVNMIAQRCVVNGASVFSDPKTVDLCVRYSGYEYLVEVKSITPSNFIARLRYAIGQVHQYNYMLPNTCSANRRLVLAFTAEIPDDSWSIPFITEYMSMDLLTLRSSNLKICSNHEMSHKLFA
ncbi:MAG: hypothetical protein IJ423_02445 [Clostridia bacterium]|nr:hypothetical protein [Clostridia bacterium]